MVPRLLAIVLVFSSLSFAGISDDVREVLQRNDFSAAEAELRSYRAKQGVTPDYLEALSSMARANLASQHLDRAGDYARQTESLSRQLLAKRALDAEPHLPIALGAALEVQAQVLAARGQTAQAIALLRRGVVTYRNTSIRARLQKNLNVLALTGQPAPPLKIESYLELTVAVSARRFACASFLLGASEPGLQSRRTGNSSSVPNSAPRPDAGRATQLYSYADTGRNTPAQMSCRT